MSCKWYNSCPLRRLEKQGKISNKWRKQYCETEDNWENCQRYQNTQKGKSNPDNLMPDGSKVDLNK